MFCSNCGKGINDGTVFCPHCGAIQSAEGKSGAGNDAYKMPDAPQPSRDQENRGGKKKGMGGIIAIVIVLVLIIAAGAGGFLYFTSDSYVIKKNLKQAEKCLDDEDYEEAVEYYEEALKKDSTLAEAYEGAAEAYLALESYEDALAILQKGLKKVRDDDAEEDLMDKMAEVYLTAVKDLSEQEKYEEAYSLAEEGIAKIEDTSTQNKLRQEQEKMGVYRIVGTYSLQYVEMYGESFSFEEYIYEYLGVSADDVKAELEMKADGRFTLDFSDFGMDIVNGTWKADGTSLTLTAEGDDVEGVLEGNTIVLIEEDYYDDTKMIFEKK